MLVEYLEMQGFQVTTVGSGERALKEMPHLAPDLLVLDVGLPGIDGFETLRRLRPVSYTHLTLPTICSV